MKIWPCSLWVEIFINLGIHFLVCPAFSHGNFVNFCLKPRANYINFWNTKTLLCKFWGNYFQSIFSLVPRVIPPVTSQLTTVFFMHFVWFTNWRGQTFCKYRLNKSVPSSQTKTEVNKKKRNNKIKGKQIAFEVTHAWDCFTTCVSIANISIEHYMEGVIR